MNFYVVVIFSRVALVTKQGKEDYHVTVMRYFKLSSKQSKLVFSV